jgi:hypothetical protein
MNTRQRVNVSARLLIAIERERKSRDAPGLFNSVEREIISRELKDLETEWVTNDPDGCLERAIRLLKTPRDERRSGRA